MMKTFFTALIMGACGALAIFTSFALEWPAWVMFIAWVSYYLFGKAIKPAAISLLQIAMGIVMGIVIRVAGTGFTTIAGPLGFPLAVFLLIGSLAYISRIRLLSNIPAWFLGLIIFFGVHPPMEPLPVLLLFLPIVAGFLFAFINDRAINLVAQPIKNNH